MVDEIDDWWLTQWAQLSDITSVWLLYLGMQSPDCNVDFVCNISPVLSVPYWHIRSYVGPIQVRFQGGMIEIGKVCSLEMNIYLGRLEIQKGRGDQSTFDGM